MSKLVDEFRKRVQIGEQWDEITWKIEPARELLAHIERLQAQLAEAKTLFLTERTEGLTDQEQQEEWDDAEEYFERQMALTAQQADKGE